MYPQFVVARLVAGLAAGVGTSHVIKKIVLNNVTIETGVDAAKVWIGRVVLQGMISDLAVKYVNDQFDTAEVWMTKAQKLIDSKAEESAKEAEGS